MGKRMSNSRRWQKINDMSYNQLISDLSMYVKKRAQRSDDSILLRHMDDVVRTGPDEHLMSDFEHMKTSLYLTDVVVLRHEGEHSRSGETQSHQEDQSVERAHQDSVHRQGCGWVCCDAATEISGCRTAQGPERPGQATLCSMETIQSIQDKKKIPLPDPGIHMSLLSTSQCKQLTECTLRRHDRMQADSFNSSWTCLMWLRQQPSGYVKKPAQRSDDSMTWMSRCLLVRQCGRAAQSDTLSGSALGAGCRRMGTRFWDCVGTEFAPRVLPSRCHRWNVQKTVEIPQLKDRCRRSRRCFTIRSRTC